MPPKKSTRKPSAKRPRSPDATEKTADPATTKRPQKRAKTSSASTDELEIPTEPTPAKSTEPETPSPTGKFDLYMMDLTFLAAPYLPAGESKPRWDSLYKEIVKVQTKKDYTARCLLPGTQGEDGRLVSRTSIDAMEEMPFDIRIADITLVDQLSFSAAERTKFVTPPLCGPGITGRLELEDDHCGIQSATGDFRMKYASSVRGADGADVEIFEGYFAFDVAHSGMYKRKGHGAGRKSKFAFWAVRARRDAAGVEIGLSER
ncbi:hypothetical protein B0H15DRAFT_460183 [Mycena belliarum]|uniref:Uncharacterized protein n=1 Tax=Mycena belliarum TaxID=1033014 RepID=A0AAD6UGP0_9AGAR|nr:hypothetical protein B0H15DRAFT_460183 [Mycena belliae]